MKAVVIGMAVAVVLAVGAAQLLNSKVQQSVAQRFATTGVRL